MTAPTVSSILTPPVYPAIVGDSFHNQWRRLCHLRSVGFWPGSILDLGAYHGAWAVLVKTLWPGVEVLCVEADEGCREPLTKGGQTFEIAVLADKDGEATFYRCNGREGEGNGLYPENSVHSFQPTPVRTKTLATLVQERGITAPFDFIKMDCQGAELSIVAGGEDVAKAAHVVLLETQVQEYNEGAPRAEDVISLMVQLGFRLYDVIDLHYNSRGLLLQTDMLFARVDSPLFQIRPLS